MKQVAHGSNRGSQSGQALLWFLATAATCCAVLALVYNVGQVTNEKEKTINAVDASALSGALVEARMLNFEAYTNRAIVANEVAIAQIISLDSWVRYDNQLAQNLNTLVSSIPIIDAFSGITASIAEITQYAQQGVDYAAQYGIPAEDYVVQGLGAARDVANGVAVLAAKDVASQIAQANQTTFGNRYDAAPQVLSDSAFDLATFAVNQNAWSNFTKVYGKNDNGNDDRGNAAQVIQNARDQFSTHRGDGLLIDSINLSLGGPFAVNGIDKTSGDTVLRDYDRWEAQDSADWWVGLQVFGITVAKVDTIPLGWGRADTDSDGSTGKDWDFGGGPCTQWIALGCELAYQNDQGYSGWNGIPGIRDLANPGSASNDPSLTYVVAVEKSDQATLTTQRLGAGMNNVALAGPQGSPQLQDRFQNEQLSAISAARVFFARPDWNSRDITEGKLPRGDKVHEYASLYNPYWQARLTTPDTTVTSLLYAAIGKPGLNLVMP